VVLRLGCSRNRIASVHPYQVVAGHDRRVGHLDRDQNQLSGN
jgi:hypothetical protein